VAGVNPRPTLAPIKEQIPMNPSPPRGAFRERHEARGGRRWPMRGVQRPFRIGGPSCMVPARATVRHCGSTGGEAGRGQSADRPRLSPRAVDSLVKSTGDPAEQASNTARGTPGLRQSLRRVLPVCFHSLAHRAAGFIGPRRSARPRFNGGKTCANLGRRNAPRERGHVP
jgi:hypothetical protein